MITHDGKKWLLTWIACCVCEIWCVLHFEVGKLTNWISVQSMFYRKLLHKPGCVKSPLPTNNRLRQFVSL